MRGPSPVPRPVHPLRYAARALSLPGRLLSSLFLLGFLAMGLLFLGLITRSVAQSLRPLRWQPVACTILESRVTEDGRERTPYSAVVRYTYAWNGRSHTNSRVSLDGTQHQDYAKAQAVVSAFPIGTAVDGLVDPGNPSDAVLQRPSWVQLFIPAAFGLIPLAFVVVGLGGLWFIWRPPPQAAAGAKSAIPAAPVALSSRAVPRGPPGCLAVFFLAFLAAGVAGTWFLGVRPLVRSLAARNWPSVPCTILSSQVRSENSDDGTTYRIDILYRYVVDDREYKSSRYDFVGGSSSGFDGKQAVVGRHPPGSAGTCFYNPANPAEAVLERGLVATMWFALIPLVFLGVGGAGLVYAIRGSFGHQPRVGPGAVASAPPPPAASTAPVTLRATRSRLVTFLGALFVCLFWNGIVSVFVWQAVKGFQRGHPEWVLTLFMIPFVVIGVGLLGFLAHSCLRFLTPGVTLRLNPPVVRLGETLRADWSLTGYIGGVHELRFWLEGRAEATGPDGDGTTTHKSTFARIELGVARLDAGLRSGGLQQVAPPAGSMHSFASPHNKIRWLLHVDGAIRFWPDVKEEFELKVLPGNPAHFPPR